MVKAFKFISGGKNSHNIEHHTQSGLIIQWTSDNIGHKFTWTKQDFYNFMLCYCEARVIYQYFSID